MGAILTCLLEGWRVWECTVKLHRSGIGTTPQPSPLACHFACLWGQACAEVKMDRGVGERVARKSHPSLGG